MYWLSSTLVHEGKVLPFQSSIMNFSFGPCRDTDFQKRITRLVFRLHLYSLRNGKPHSKTCWGHYMHAYHVGTLISEVAFIARLDRVMQACNNPPCSHPTSVHTTYRSYRSGTWMYVQLDMYTLTMYMYMYYYSMLFIIVVSFSFGKKSYTLITEG